MGSRAWLGLGQAGTSNAPCKQPDSEGVTVMVPEGPATALVICAEATLQAGTRSSHTVCHIPEVGVYLIP